MVDWKLYLESICEKYAQWWDSYTLTNVVGNKSDKKVRKSLLLDLQAIAVKPEREQFLEAREEREVFNVLEGLRKYAPEHVLLTGRPGSGKSTALVRLLLEEAEKTSPQTPLRRGEGLNNAPPTLVGKGVGGLGQIPVLVELRYYETSILDLITAFLHRHDPSLTIDCETIKTLLRQGQFLLLLDGVNELPSSEAQRNLQKFRQDYQQTTPMVFTTRDLGVGGDLGINKRLEMQPLTETQMGEFVRGYLPETGEQMLQQLGGRLREFGETPLLLMMLCSVFASNENQIPPNLGSVFRRFTEIYDGQLKQDIPITDESRRWWKRLLQHLAWVMMTSPPNNAPHSVILSAEKRSEESHKLDGKTEFLIAIPRQQAEEIFTEFLEGKVNCAANCAISWLNDLLKHHLIQIGTENKIEFRHQLIQEYYAAERFLQEVGKLSDDELQWDYLNYLKWTEPAALMLGLLDDEGLALRVVRLALQVDWQLGARLAGEVKLEWHKQTVGLVESLNIPLLLKIRFFGKTRSEAAVPELIKLIEHQNSDVRESAANALGEIKSEAAIPGLIKLLEDKDSDVCTSAAYALVKIKSELAIPELVKILEKEDLSIFYNAAHVLANIKYEIAIHKLIELLAHKESSIIRCAASLLGEMESEAAISPLINLLEHQDPSIIHSAALALGKIKSEAAISKLISLLKHQDTSIIHSAALALGGIKSEEAFRFIQLLDDEYSSTIRRRSYLLGKFQSELVIPTTPISAAFALEDAKSELAIPRLIKLPKDEDSNIGHLATSAFIEIKSEGAIPGLIKLLEQEDYLHIIVADALIEIKSETAMINLVKIINNQNFIQINNGKNSLNALNALEKIQEHLKYYKPAPIRSMSNILSHNYALFIGVGECEERKLSLPVTVKDIQALKTLLTDRNLCGYIDNDQHLRLLSNTTATSENILDGLNWLKQQAENDPEATIFIYYSGHGCLDASGDYYLIPHETDRADIADTALPATKFNAALQQIPAKQLLVIIDSCHAQGMASSKEGANRPPLPKGFSQTALPKNIIQQGTGKVVFTSSTGNQSSWIRPDGKMSVFTYHLLEALQGAANQPGDKVVRVSHLMNYLGKTVPETARELCKAEQTPFFDFATEDFAIALLHGGKGLATEGWDKQEAEEKIRGISNQVNNGVGIVGDRNIGINIGTAGDIHYHGK